ncbi:MAG: peptide chain release factor N(5)-glutamine methyltransferase [Gammaproteobacteria bacterium]|nr:peptide chain release factor N(5)-glutamine methyltransferase [Gammaproteobacteria bacterium]
MTTVDQLLRDGARRLGSLGGSPRLDAELLLAHVLGQGREDLYRSLFATVPASAEARYAQLLARRETRCPVAQLTGHREFWSLKLEVTHATLVPRPETELLVERVLKRISPDAAWCVADLGTGTGAIALAVARERPACRITATDLSKPALAVARRNARALNIRNVNFKQGNWFEALPMPGPRKGRFHLLVSNPPYIAAGEWQLTDPELGFEPRVALDGGTDGLDAYRTITAQAPGYLHPGGWLLFEHGFRQGDEVRALLKCAGFSNIRTITDLAGRPRVSEGQIGGTVP